MGDVQKEAHQASGLLVGVDRCLEGQNVPDLPPGMGLTHGAQGDAVLQELLLVAVKSRRVDVEAQFLWRYVDQLIGKGLSVEVLAQFFWYMSLMLVPQALPLAILLSALIAF